MRGKLALLVFVLLCQFALAQSGSRKILKAKVLGDEKAVENGLVLNVNAGIKTFITAQGEFQISAKPQDTLLVTSLSFESKKIVLKEKDFLVPPLTFTLQIINTELNEVLIGRELEVKSLGVGSQRYVDMLLEDDNQSTAKNITGYSDQTIKYGMDFVRIFKDVKKMLSKKTEIQPQQISDKAFISYAKLNFSEEFYSKTLSLQPNEIELFLLYCSNDKAVLQYLKPDDQFLLMDYLINKNTEFKKLPTILE